MTEREPIAIVGLGCRFPGGADTPAKFWDLLAAGGDGVREIDRWTATEGSGLPRWGATLDGIDRFDADFFGIQAMEASRMDPQQRLLLEVIWEALENAGEPLDAAARSRAGVFVGIYNTDYAWEQHGAHALDDVYSGIGSGGAIAANRVSYLLDLRGPSLAVDTTCSSSLVAVHLAVESLRRGETDLAIAAGVNLTLSATVARSVAAVIPMAGDGFCKPFDSRADGIVRGEACAAVVLKRVSDAVSAHDPILAVIAGSAVNQDGKSNGFTAPNPAAQEDVIRAALADARLEPATISYIEAHGTGTALGDPIEWDALDAVLGSAPRQGRCLVGSVKANVGHCEAASGIAGLAKVILALRHRRIPVQPHFESPSRHLRNYGRHLITPSATIAWSGPEPRRAGVSAFSVGGTNAHVILEEAPAEPEMQPRMDGPRQYVLPLSARHPDALRELARGYIALLDEGVDAHDLCYSAARRRPHLALRLAVTAASAAGLRAGLERRLLDGAAESSSIAAEYERGDDPDWAALYPDGRFVPLPNYPWQRQRYWFTASAPAPAAASASTVSDVGPRRYIYEVDWIETGAAAASSVRAFDPRAADRIMSAALPALAEESGFVEYRKSAPALETRAGRAIEAALYRDGWRPAAGSTFTGPELRATLRVRDGYERLFARVLEVLAEDGVIENIGHDRWRVARPPRDYSWNDGGAADRGSEAALLQRCTERFCEALRGDCSPLQLLFPDGRMDHAEALFSQSAFAKLFNGLATRALSSIVASVPAGASIRVLEIGAGTGGTTASLLAECPGERTRYLFTDISPAFFSHAREKFGSYPFVGYQTLDIESEPAAQGFEDQQFDVIVAAHVLHATSDLRVALRHARTLLAPGGVMLVVESTLRQRLIDFTYGLTPGWWKHADEDLRGHHPLLPASRWVDLLQATGFEAVSCCPGTDATPDAYGAAVIVAKAAALPAESTMPAGRWIVVGAPEHARGCRTAMEDRGASVEVLPTIDRLDAALDGGDCRGVVLLNGIDASCCEADGGERLLDVTTASCAELVSAAHTLGARAQTRSRLWVLTRGARSRRPALAQAPLTAMGAVVAAEYPAMWGGAIDLDVDEEPDWNQVADAILRAAPGAELVVRDHRVRSRTIVRAAMPSATGGVHFDRHRSYLITGGFGGMGLRIADWMSARGAGCLVLVGRRGETPESGATIEAMERRGTVVVREAADVADEAAVRGLLARIRRSPYALRGVIHAAGIFEDQLLAKHEWDYFRRVFLPKAVGAWNLHRLTSDGTLDHFVLCSSAAQYLNPTGLANYTVANAFLDALAHYRRARSLPAVSIAWAGWTGTGMVNAMPARRADDWARQGVRSLDPEAGLAVLEQLLAGGPAHAIVMDLDRSGAATRPATGATLRDRVAGAAAVERERAVRTLVAAEIARIMDSPGTAVESTTPLADAGFDSLMALELRNSLAAAAALDLPASLVFDYPTADALTARLLHLLCPDAAAAPTAASAETRLSSLIDEVGALSDAEVEAELEAFARTFLNTR